LLVSVIQLVQTQLKLDGMGLDYNFFQFLWVFGLIGNNKKLNLRRRTHSLKATY